MAAKADNFLCLTPPALGRGLPVQYISITHREMRDIPTEKKLDHCHGQLKIDAKLNHSE